MFKIIDKTNKLIDENQKVSFWVFGIIGYFAVLLLIPYASITEKPILIILGLSISLLTLYIHGRVFEKDWEKSRKRHLTIKLTRFKRLKEQI